MDSRKVILLVGALLVAAVTAFMARSLMSGSATPEAIAAPLPVKVDGPEVLVATRALPVGTILDPTAMKFQPWPKELVEGAYLLKEKTNVAQLAGTVVREAITAGSPVTNGALVKPGDRGFLAAALAPGMRAVTFPVTGTNAVSGFVFPGDRVDVMLTQEVRGNGEGEPLRVSETIVRNLRVLATDTRTDNQPDEAGKSQVRGFSSVTIEATPRMAEQIAVAQTLGSLSLALRPLADSRSELDAAIASGAVTVPANGDPKAESAMTVRVAAQPQTGRTTFATGGDVSRFERRTVPTKANEPPKEPTVKVVRQNNVADVPVKGK